MSAAARALKDRLPRTWSVFFAQHGNFTPAQLAAAPLILDGADVVLCAPTASGKTEAAIAPLIERHIPPNPDSALYLLYLTPTRALVNDLYERLHLQLSELRLRLGIRTGDRGILDTGKHAPHILITTPESLDSLLTTRPALFSTVRAVVIDELHIFDGTARGDQLRVLLNRLRWVRDYAHQAGETRDSALQGVMLSATLNKPEAVAGRYFSGAQAVVMGGGRSVQADFLALTDGDSAALIALLCQASGLGWRKVLLFCNTRAEVEGYAAAVRQAEQPFGQAIYVHYSNLSTERRLEVEDGFSSAEVALCFASSTLELGIDIGSIDHIILLGAPGEYGALMQRIGRGRRRQSSIHVTCAYRNTLERLIFETLLAMDGVPDRPPIAFRPSVVVQQIFSLIKQSPQASVRVRPLTGLFTGMASESQIRAILGELQAGSWLTNPRTDEFWAGERLNHLIDRQGMPTTSLSLHSNIQSSSGPMLDVRDQTTGSRIARVGGEAFVDGVLTLGGRTMHVEWTDGEVILASTSPDESPLARPAHLRGSRATMPYETTSRVGSQLGFQRGDAPFIQPDDGGWLWLHGLGDVYAEALFHLMEGRWGMVRGDAPWLWFAVDEIPATLKLPTFTVSEVERHLRNHRPQYERLLSMGAYHRLLPPDEQIRAVIAQFNPVYFLEVLTHLRVFEGSSSHITTPSGYNDGAAPMGIFGK